MERIANISLFDSLQNAHNSSIGYFGDGFSVSCNAKKQGAREAHYAKLDKAIDKSKDFEEETDGNIISRDSYDMFGGLDFAQGSNITPFNPFSAEYKDEKYDRNYSLISEYNVDDIIKKGVGSNSRTREEVNNLIRSDKALSCYTRGNSLFVESVPFSGKYQYVGDFEELINIPHYNRPGGYIVVVDENGNVKTKTYNTQKELEDYQKILEPDSDEENANTKYDDNVSDSEEELNKELGTPDNEEDLGVEAVFPDFWNMRNETQKVKNAKKSSRTIFGKPLSGVDMTYLRSLPPSDSKYVADELGKAFVSGNDVRINLTDTPFQLYKKLKEGNTLGKQDTIKSIQQLSKDDVDNVPRKTLGEQRDFIIIPNEIIRSQYDVLLSLLAYQDRYYTDPTTTMADFEIKDEEVQGDLEKIKDENEGLPEYDYESDFDEETEKGKKGKGRKSKDVSYVRMKKDRTNNAIIKSFITSTLHNLSPDIRQSILSNLKSLSFDLESYTNDSAGFEINMQTGDVGVVTGVHTNDMVIKDDRSNSVGVTIHLPSTKDLFNYVSGGAVKDDNLICRVVDVKKNKEVSGRVGRGVYDVILSRKVPGGEKVLKERRVTVIPENKSYTNYGENIDSDSFFMPFAFYKDNRVAITKALSDDSAQGQNISWYNRDIKSFASSMSGAEQDCAVYGIYKLLLSKKQLMGVEIHKDGTVVPSTGSNSSDSIYIPYERLIQLADDFDGLNKLFPKASYLFGKKKNNQKKTSVTDKSLENMTIPQMVEALTSGNLDYITAKSLVQNLFNPQILLLRTIKNYTGSYNYDRLYEYLRRDGTLQNMGQGIENDLVHLLSEKEYQQTISELKRCTNAYLDLRNLYDVCVGALEDLEHTVDRYSPYIKADNS